MYLCVCVSCMFENTLYVTWIKTWPSGKSRSFMSLLVGLVVKLIYIYQVDVLKWTDLEA